MRHFPAQPARAVDFPEGLHPRLRETLFGRGYRCEVTYVKPDSTGRVAAGSVAEALRADTILVSILHANNETGTINPLREIGTITKERNVLFHVDAVQSFGKLPVNVDDLHVDLLSISAHKVHGPKGVGVLYIREGVTIHPLIHGGRHEGNLRAGTENVAGIAGMGEAVRLNWPALERNGRRMLALRDRLELGLRERVTGIVAYNNKGATFRTYKGKGTV